VCYLKYFPQPFLDDLVAGRVLPVVGAGLSKNAVPPLSVFSEVAKELAQQIPGYVYMDPIDAVSAYEFEYSRLKMVEEIAQLLNRSDVQPGPAIEALPNCRLNRWLLPTGNICWSGLMPLLVERRYPWWKRRSFLRV